MGTIFGWTIPWRESERERDRSLSVCVCGVWPSGVKWDPRCSSWTPRRLSPLMSSCLERWFFSSHLHTESLTSSDRDQREPASDAHTHAPLGGYTKRTGTHTNKQASTQTHFSAGVVRSTFVMKTLLETKLITSREIMFSNISSCVIPDEVAECLRHQRWRLPEDTRPSAWGRMNPEGGAVSLLHSQHQQPRFFMRQMTNTHHNSDAIIVKNKIDILSYSVLYSNIMIIWGMLWWC